MPADRLKDIVEALEIQVDEYSSFVDRETGEVETVSHELLHEAEELDDDEEELDLPAWQEHEWEAAKLIVARIAFGSFPRSLRSTNGQLWRIFRSR
jgi:hypothetical protein